MVAQLPHVWNRNILTKKNAYLRCIGEQLTNALSDKGKLGTIFKGLTHYILAKYGVQKIYLGSNTTIVIDHPPLEQYTLSK